MRLIELRQYTLHPGRRDELIDLFEAHFVDGQHAFGMEVLGTFRDLDRPDVFVWLRAFPSERERLEALRGFYTSPIWQEHGPAANDTMIDSDDVLLLREVGGALPQGEGLVIGVWDAPAGPDGWVLETALVPNEFPLPVRDDRCVVALSRALPSLPGAKQVLRLEPTPTSALR